MMIGNVLQVTPELFEILDAHARDFVDARAYAAPGSARKEGSVALIKQDLPRTFPRLSFFHSDGCREAADLRRLLEVYVFYRPDVGYIQARLSFGVLVGVLLGCVYM